MSFHCTGPAGTVGVGVGVTVGCVALAVGEPDLVGVVARPLAVLVAFAVAVLPARADFAGTIAVATLTGDCTAAAPAAALRAPPAGSVPHPAAAAAAAMASTLSHRPALTVKPPPRAGATPAPPAPE
jgi:hypothetical protein